MISVASTAPGPIGTGVSALLGVKVGTPLSRWLNDTWLPFTRSGSPSPLTSLKYTELVVNVSAWLYITFAPRYSSGPAEKVVAVSWPSADRLGSDTAGPKTLIPFGPDRLSRNETWPPLLLKTLSGNP